MLYRAAMEFGYSIAGFFVGAIVGLTGVGGGSLMTPLLVLLFGIHPAVAVGTDLLYAALTKAGGAVVHGRNGAVDWRIVLELGAGSVPAAALTLWWLSTHSDSTYGSQHLISGTLGVALLLTACALLFRKRLQAVAERPGISEWRERHLRSLTVGTGVMLGALVTISSVGAGCAGYRGTGVSVPATVGGAHRRQRHRPCGAAHAGGRTGSLVAGQCRLGAARRPAHRLAPGHRTGQPDCGKAAGAFPAAAAGHHAVRDRRKTEPESSRLKARRQPAVQDCSRTTD
jgi:hypothetical protein